MVNLCSLTAEQIVKGIINEEFSAEEYISQILERIEKIDDKVNAFVIVDNSGALEKARLIDKKVRNGEDEKDIGSLAGVAVGVKDNICTRDLRTTCASKMLQDYVPPYDATVVRKLKGDGAIVVGKLNLDEFAMGSTTEFSKYGNNLPGIKNQDTIHLY